MNRNSSWICSVFSSVDWSGGHAGVDIGVGEISGKIKSGGGGGITTGCSSRGASNDESSWDGCICQNQNIIFIVKCSDDISFL